MVVGCVVDGGQRRGGATESFESCSDDRSCSDGTGVRLHFDVAMGGRGMIHVGKKVCLVRDVKQENINLKIDMNHENKIDLK